MPAENSNSDMSSIIFNTLKQELLDLTIKPGEEIPEATICERFNVTRPPVRTAFRRLCDIGLVEIKPYYGTKATLLDIDKIHQIIHMRTILESRVIQDFILSKPDAFVIEELEHNIRQQQILLEQKNVDRTKFYDLDNELHRTWFDAMHCNHIWQIIDSQKIEYKRFRMLDYKTSMKYSEMVEDHTKLVETIKERNSKAVVSVLGQHLNNGIIRMGESVFTEYSDYFIKPENNTYWQKYNQRYYK